LRQGDGKGFMTGYVYILFNKRNGTLYTGVTSDLRRRMQEHKQKLVDGFSKTYGTDKLGYVEEYPTITQAIAREKAIKFWKREWKIKHIEEMNPNWDDLSNYLHNI
jgi:putative endonuclease